MRDVLFVPYNKQYLVIASDNSGGIGNKEKDIVKVPYHIVAYYSFRVALMECMSAGALPVSVIMQNFCGAAAWNALQKGVRQGLEELGMNLPISGSTESNMVLIQSAIGMSVIGISDNRHDHENINLKAARFAVIGKPLVGDEVIDQPQSIAPLCLFKWLCEQDNVTIMPVGSKGIAYELRQLLPEITPEGIIISELDLEKSAGPSTCFIISYPPQMEDTILELTGDLFYGLYLPNE